MSEHLCDIPINPSALAEMKKSLYSDPYGFIEGKKVVPTQCMSIKNEVFIALLEMASAISAGLDWEKKGRIVLEYDPQAKRFQVFTFQEANDLDIGPTHEEVPRFLLHPEER